MTTETGADSQLAARFNSGAFVVTAELTPPISTDPTDFIKKALPLKGLATAVNVTDGASAKPHLSSIAAAHFLIQNGIEPILQFTCRDRNRIALQSDLIGAYAMGVRNLLILGGDDPKAGDQPETKPVFDLDSKGLLAMANSMTTTHKLPTGVEIKGPMAYTLGGADMPIDPPADWKPTSLQGKIDSGAVFVQTQFAMDIDLVRRYARRLVDLGIAPKLKVLIGICPIPSPKSARWMKEKLFGTKIADSIIDRLDKAADPKVEGKKICMELMQQLAETPGIAGCHIMAPVNPSVMPEVIAESGVIKRQAAKV